MRPLVIILLIVLAASTLFCQPEKSAMQKQLDELRSRIKALEAENRSLRMAERSNDSLAYAAMRSEIFEAFTGLPGLDFDFKSTTEKIAVTGLFTKLMQANNPTSEILGFRFSEVIITASEKYLMNILKEEKDKKRFSQVLSKIIENPVVSALANTNPITSVVSAIINTIAGFTVSRVEVDRDGGRVRDVRVDQQDAFDNRRIEAFRNALQVYIDFYDALIVASIDYLEGLEGLKKKYEYLVESVNEFKKDLSNGIDAEDKSLLISLSKFFPDPSTKAIDFRSKINDPEIRERLLIARRYPALARDVTKFKKEYNALLINFLSDYIETLKTADRFSDSDIDKSKTLCLISDIESFVADQKIREQ